MPLSIASTRRPYPDLSEYYPSSIQQHDALHWSPGSVIQKAVQFLACPQPAKILDIGSGAGKFCLLGADLDPHSFFYGVEQRKHLVSLSNHIKDQMNLRNVQFMHQNFTQINLKKFDAFYFYNSFYENIGEEEKIDDTIAYSVDLYLYYSRYLKKELDDMPSGTKISTYCSWDDEIPTGYTLIKTEEKGLLKYWIKS